MKNQREIYEALLAGETLDNGDFTCMLNVQGDLVDDEMDYIDLDFESPQSWQIYKEPKWYENIPDGGVLCWVSDIQNDSDATIRSVIGYCDDSTHFFETLEESWMHAKPLEKQEIQIYLDNAPDNS